MPDEKSHHVAWADRIGLNKQWARDVQMCSDAYGSKTYFILVKRFRNNIPNIKNGPQLKDMITEFVNKYLEQWKLDQLEIWKTRNPQKANFSPSVRAKEKDIEYAAQEELYKYMVQLLEEQGFCFYESTIEEDEMI